MWVVTQFSRALQTVLSTEAERTAIRCRVIRRRRKLDGPSLIQGLVLGWMKHPSASLEQLAQMTAVCGVTITPQALDERFTPQLAECCKQLLEQTVAQTIHTAPAAVELLNRPICRRVLLRGDVRVVGTLRRSRQKVWVLALGQRCRITVV